MNMLYDKFMRLAMTRRDIKEAIEGKKVEVPDGATFRSYADYIEQIQNGIPGVRSYYLNKSQFTPHSSNVQTKPLVTLLKGATVWAANPIMAGGVTIPGPSAPLRMTETRHITGQDVLSMSAAETYITVKVE